MKNRAVTASLPEDLYEDLVREAEAAGVSPSALARSILSDHLARKGEAIVQELQEGETISWMQWDAAVTQEEEDGIRVTLAARPGWDGSAPDPERLAEALRLPPPGSSVWSWTDLKSPIPRVRSRPSRSLLQEVRITEAEAGGEEDDPLVGIL